MSFRCRMKCLATPVVEAELTLDAIAQRYREVTRNYRKTSSMVWKIQKEFEKKKTEITVILRNTLLPIKDFLQKFWNIEAGKTEKLRNR